MGLQETKLNVTQKIIGFSQPSLLNKIDKLLEEEMVVGYTTDGVPLTKGEYDLHLQNAEQQLNSGQYLR